MLEDYKPEWAHLHDIISVTECSISPDVLLKQGKFNKYLYHNFFYFDSILENLKLNKLIDKTQENLIRIHYNFLSKYTHTSIDNIEMWRTLNESMSNSQLQKIIQELALL